MLLLDMGILDCGAKFRLGQEARRRDIKSVRSPWVGCLTSITAQPPTWEVVWFKRRWPLARAEEAPGVPSSGPHVQVSLCFSQRLCSVGDGLTGGDPFCTVGISLSGFWKFSCGS